jgi:hypothetical protein
LSTVHGKSLRACYCGTWNKKFCLGIQTRH